MKTQLKKLTFLLIFLTFPVYGNTEKVYTPARVVYDITTASPSSINHIISRVSLLQKIYNHDTFDAEIILVIHDKAIPLLVKQNKNTLKLKKRMADLVLAGITRIRVCKTSAKIQGFTRHDFDSYIDLIPMADAEIVFLQKQGYAYLR